MNIALIAHDKKKELMASFCIAYRSILKNHTLFATGTTGAIIVEATGLNVHRFLPGVMGEQQISARAAYNELDLVIFFRDPISAKSDEPDIHSLLRECDINNIPFATNLGTAEMLIKGLERGDLDWRELIKK
ncbi:MAG TPA: methylglyoxal synthase [Hungateiclostridium thermocellum]|jgi:methylglyoxal synthase|uniref:Methylglyoxal synthase n=2 Tax=Acetivibrio thermocellus TaxID=1515 RepID=A3DBK7_ACET2|nr:methylglyoxal synthase [Acetivibrio thermocellus]CDG34778.1 methylglyoxal synthase [Acetivibrio thermocellus BC1]ABN51336.1 methylglyoxal synthase [Acetivibrio thermocellus ATCC 27405]ADU75177.1 methylglyoxal synthase [Acetivibrio thermocellus DSM 1313]ALX09152.1 Methylglyoxal synthase [Acetivibrio thermocellus AD2]ANV76904.1 Methylglyoxal synthase [Acetivibrio thermocellus DSM 2360]